MIKFYVTAELNQITKENNDIFRDWKLRYEKHINDDMIKIQSTKRFIRSYSNYFNECNKHLTSHIELYRGSVEQYKQETTTADTLSDRIKKDNKDIEEFIQHVNNVGVENIVLSDMMKKIIVNYKKTDVCSICFDEIDINESCFAIKMMCDHLYHLPCIKDWVYKEDRDDCPMCKTVGSYMIVSTSPLPTL